MWTILHGNPHGERPRGDAWNQQMESTKALALDKVRELLNMGIIVHEIHDDAGNLVMNETAITEKFRPPWQKAR